MINTYGIIILAAGPSGRLGQPKQLLPYQDKTLLQFLIDEATTSTASSIIVVLGANATLIEPVLETSHVQIIINKNWEEGMASSIRCGITALQKIKPSLDAAIIMVGDQPFITASLLNNLMTTLQEINTPIVTCSYDNTTGPPSIFHKDLFPELLQLTGDTGARSIVQKYAEEIVTIAFPSGNIDIDTQEDYANIQKDSE